MDTIEIIKVIEIDEAIIQLRSDGVIHVHYKEYTEVTVELQIKTYKLFEEICGGVKRPFLFTADEYVTVTKEARENAIKMEDRYVGSKTAVIAKSAAYKLLANFYVKINKPKTPFRAFSSEEDAIAWLNAKN